MERSAASPLLASSSPTGPKVTVIALVPAHNEQDQIAATIRSLYEQTRVPDKTIVISDNSTDKTVEIVEKLMPACPGLCVIETVGNRAKKAGALNFGIRTAQGDSDTIYCQMDADTIIAPNIIEEGLKALAANPRLGGLCSRCGVKPFEECSRAQDSHPNRLERTVWLFQSIEYGLTDGRRADLSGKVKVMAGAFTMYRYNALLKVAQKYADRGEFHVWDEQSIVEDYTLTLDVRALGYLANAGQNMRSWTDVPITPGDLWRQRKRWYTGSVSEIRHRRFKPEIRIQALNEVLQIVMGLARLFCWALVVFVLFNPQYGFELNFLTVSLTLATIILGWAIYLPNLKYIEHVTPLQRIIPLTLIPMLLYSFWDEFVMYRSYFDCFTNAQQHWSGKEETLPE